MCGTRAPHLLAAPKFAEQRRPCRAVVVKRRRALPRKQCALQGIGPPPARPLPGKRLNGSQTPPFGIDPWRAFAKSFGMVSLSEVVAFCDARVRRAEIADFEGSHNGLQLENSGTVTRIGAAVDAGIEPFRLAVEREVDFLICHHGMFWDPPIPVTASRYRKLRCAMEGNLAVYGAHLPLDCHPEIGNNALLAEQLGLRKTGTFLPYEGTPIGLLAEGINSRQALHQRLQALFPGGVTMVSGGSEKLSSIAILTGSGSSAVPHLRAAGADTLITGELKQHFFNVAQEEGLNLFVCGHYATEVFGVQALAKEAGRHFNLPVEFIATDCPL